MKTYYSPRDPIEFVLFAFTLMAGKSGTCILLIFQINILGSGISDVSSTNFV